MSKKKRRRTHKYRSEEVERRLLMTHGYNPDVLYLGTLCRRGHDFEDTGCSVRNRKHGYCCECSKLTQLRYKRSRAVQQAEYRAKNKEKVRESARRYRIRNKERISAYFKKWYAENRERIRQRRNTPEYRAARGSSYDKTIEHKGGNP